MLVSVTAKILLIYLEVQIGRILYIDLYVSEFNENKSCVAVFKKLIVNHHRSIKLVLG